MAGNGSASVLVSIDHSANLVTVVGYGFWTADTAAACEIQLRDAIGQVSGHPWRLLFDFTQLLPQSAEVQDMLRDTFRSVHSSGPKHSAVAAADAVTTLQMKRLWSESGARSCSFVASVSAARLALGG
ncbi:hypothetical protein ACFL5O_10530 [Myxococcota bacterium]